MRYALGTVQFGMDYGVQGACKPGRKTAFRILDRALEAGIDTLDTASAYGDAETVIGDYLKGNGDGDTEQGQGRQPSIKGCSDENRGWKRQVKLISKLAAGVFQEKEKKRWSGIAVETVGQSLDRLGVPGLEAYLFHNASCLFDPEAVNALYTVVEEGLAKKIGVSIYTPEEAMKALEYPQIRVIQIPYNVFDRRLDRCGFFKRAKERGVEVYARSSLLQGLALMDPDKGEGLPERMRFAKQYVRKFRAICEEYRVPPLEAAVGYAGNHKGIDCVVFGVDSERQLEEYLSMRSAALPKEMEEKLESAFETVEEKLVNPVLWT